MQLRFFTTKAAVVVRTCNQFEKRTFFVCGPNIWNNVPPPSGTFTLLWLAFCTGFKTYMFKQL